MTTHQYHSVVRIYATTQAPNYENPWQADTPNNGTGSGVVVGAGRILTGAHVVANGTFVQVQKVSDPNKWIARIVAINHDCDLALLEVVDPKFMEGVKPEPIGELPDLRARVSVVGYPVGGEEISITEGVVSRREVQKYSHSKRMLLAVTVDAAINDGNSGGPVFHKGRVCGIAFQTLNDAENIGEMVPSNLIRRFLAGVAEERQSRVPGLGIAVQSLENPALRRHVRLPDDLSGVLVERVEFQGAAHGVIEEGDALLKIGGLAIANNGTVQYRGEFRTSFDVVLGDRFVGDDLKLTLWRDGKTIDTRTTLEPYRCLVPRATYDRTPDYLVTGGMVFQPLSLDFLRCWHKWWEKAPAEFLAAYYNGHRTKERQQLIAISQVLADEINVGFDELYNATVSSVNGVVPRDMSHFVELVDGGDDTVVIRTSGGSMAVFDRSALVEANERIRERYHIPHDRSPRLRGEVA